MTPKPSRPRRKGMAAFAVLAVLLVVALICAAIMKQGMARRGSARAEERLVQAEWLAESGLDRAGRRLEKAADYPGETWQIAEKDLGGRGSAVVSIQIKPVADRPRARLVRVEAEYPAGSPLRVRRVREAIMETVADAK